MKLINKSPRAYVCYEIRIEPNQALEVSDKVAEILLKQEGIEAVEETKKPEPKVDDNKQDDMAKAKAEAKELGIKFHPNIGLEKLQAKIAEAKK